MNLNSAHEAWGFYACAHVFRAAASDAGRITEDSGPSSDRQNYFKITVWYMQRCALCARFHISRPNSTTSGVR